MSPIVFQPFPILSSERIILDEIKLSDNATIFELRSNPDIIKYIKRDAYTSLEQADAFIEKIQNGIADNLWINWKILFQNSNEMLGSICLWNFSDDGKVAEIGYDLLPQYQGKGIMSEAMKLVLNYGFTHLKLNAIEAFTDKRNVASKALLKKYNFEHLIDREDEGNEMNEMYQLIRN